MFALLILLVVFGAVSALAVRSQRRPRLPATPTPALTSPPPLASAAGGRDVASLLLSLPEPARTRAWGLLCLLSDELGRGGEKSGGTDPQTRYLLTQTRDVYLPDTVLAYLSLTPGARQSLTQQGQTPEALLEEQLELMLGGVRETLRLDPAAADRLLTQGRFLRERFRQG